MNFVASPKRPNTELLPCNITVDGKIVGDLNPQIEHDGSITWHACINFGRTTHIGIGLIQGFGGSHRDAIEDAIRTGRAACEQKMNLIAGFAESIGFKE